jgi:hypothetical protein
MSRFSSTFTRLEDEARGAPPRSALLTQNLHPTSSTEQAEQASFTREKIPGRASQFSLKINKRQS